MTNGWQEVYLELTNFIAEHPEIRIEATRLRLSDNVRPEFYRLFNVVRKAFIEEKFSNLLNEATVLSQNYLKAEQDIIKLLRLEDISMEADILRFLHNPVDQLIRGAFDPLFDLLKGRIGAEMFEEGSQQNIKASFRSLYQLGYEKWVALSLVKLLEADNLFQIPLRELTLYDAHKAGGLLEELVSNPEKSKSILFKYAPDAVLMVPDLIVHSVKVNQYIAIRSQIGKAFGVAPDASQKREWYPLDSIKALGPGLTLLIYVADNPDEISLVADVEKIYRPDLIIECRGQKDWYQEEGLEKAKLHHDSLKPILGTYIVSREPVPVEEPEKQEEDIHILTVGFDQSELEPIISIMMNQEDEENSK